MVERYAKRMPDAYREEAIAWLSGATVSSTAWEQGRPKPAQHADAA